MPERAHVTSMEALEAFRENLILFVSKARPTLEDVSAGVLRTRLWLQNEQRLQLENEVRRRGRELEQAQQALSRVRLSSLNQSSIIEQKAVQKARRALDDAEAKLKRLKQWNREFDSRVDPLVKQLEKLHTVLANDMLQANAYLMQAIKTLDAYSRGAPASTTTDSSAPSSDGAAKDASTTSELAPDPGPTDRLPDTFGERST